MGKTKGLEQLIAGKAQAVGEIIGDQDLHEDGKAQAERGRDEQGERNPLKKLKPLT